LISAVVLLIELDFIEIVESAASSLACRVCKVFTLEEIMRVDLQLEESSLVPKLVDKAIQRTNTIEMDRREIFQPRLLLAEVQWHFGKR
jgi:hypothetical protein